MIRIVLLLVLAAHTGVLAQTWQKVNQKQYGMVYWLPIEWEVDAFGSESNWESGGGSVCTCAGSLNIGNRHTEEEIYMVIYPTRIKDSLTAVKRSKVWQMQIEETSVVTEFKTKRRLDFVKMISIWKPETSGDHAGKEVWRFTTYHKNKYYVMYFWAKPDVLRKYNTTINRILDSFTAKK